MKNKYSLSLLILFNIFLLFLSINCGKKYNQQMWYYSFNDVIGNISTNKPSRINLDLYIDATTSMQGFTSNPSSSYNKFLEELETAANTSWKTTNINYYKFGKKVKLIDRIGFLNAKFSSFYSEKGISEETKIDSVINKTDIERLSVVITDLFQSEADINSIVLQIKNRCFAKNIQVAILGIKSYYAGKIYDAKVPPFRFVSKIEDKNSLRPFYAIMFGEPENIMKLYDSFKNTSIIDEDNFILISKSIINEFEIKLTKKKSSIDLTKRKSENGPNTFDFTLKDQAKEGTFQMELNYKINEHSYIFDPEKIEMLSYKKINLGDKGFSDSVITQDLKIDNLVGDNKKITATLNLNLSNGKGIFSYCSYLQLPPIGGYKIPEWVKDFSSENPSQTKDSNKTLNLEKFVRDLIQANNAISCTKIAKYYLTIKH